MFCKFKKKQQLQLPLTIDGAIISEQQQFQEILKNLAYMWHVRCEANSFALLLSFSLVSISRWRDRVPEKACYLMCVPGWHAEKRRTLQSPKGWHSTSFRGFTAAASWIQMHPFFKMSRMEINNGMITAYLEKREHRTKTVVKEKVDTICNR